MVKALSAAERAAKHSRAKEEAYKDAVRIYLESRRAPATSPESPSGSVQPISLRNLAAHYKGLVNITTLSRRVQQLPSRVDDAR